MNLLIVVVEDIEQVDDVLAALVELDVAGLQVLDSASVMGFLARQSPIFAGLLQLVSRPKSESKTVFGVAEDPDILKRLDALLKRAGIDLDQPQTGHALLMPIVRQIGQLEGEE